MPVIVPPDFARILHSITLVGDPEPMAVTFGYNVAEGEDHQAVVTTLHDMWGDFMALCVADDYSLTQTEMRLHVDGQEDPVLFIATGARAGGASSDPLPQNSAYLIHKRTARAGRRGRGRLYVPGVVEGAVAANGVITDTQRTSVQSAINGWLARFQGIDVGEVPGLPVLFHNYADPEAPGSFPNQITSMIVDPIIATQRRRLR